MQTRRQTSPKRRRRGRLHRVTPAPDWRAETQVAYYQHAADVIERYMGARPSRNTLCKYLQHGFPVRPGGPYVQMPARKQLNRAVTTVEAMNRWLTVVRHLQRRHNVAGA